MITEHLSQLKNLIQDANTLPDATRTQLLSLIATVEQESSGADLNTSESAPSESPDNGDGSPTVLDQFRQSVEELEASHPEAATLVNRIATALANMGI